MSGLLPTTIADDGKISQKKSQNSQNDALQQLNKTGCYIKSVEGKGRGVFASDVIPAWAIIEMSPVLFFSPEEYELHGRHTILDHYTFKWRDGRMALALGLGSLFNHSQSPNVSFTLDPTTDSIKYTTSRQVEPDEELCIFYGHKLWFDVIDVVPSSSAVLSQEPDDGWGGLGPLSDAVEESDLDEDKSMVDGNPDEIIPEEDLPFTRVRITPDEDEEETPESIRTMQVWVVDIPDPRHLAVMLRWLKQAKLDTPGLSHLKRIRKDLQKGTSTLLISTSLDSPILPSDAGFTLPPPYQITVPRTPALTPNSLKLKTALWPTIFTPRRKGEPENWSRGKLRWARRAMRVVVSEALKAKAKGELPIVAHVPTPYEDSSEGPLPPFTAHDTRTSAQHPLRHSVLNVVRQVADFRTESKATSPLHSSTSQPPPSPLSMPTPTPLLDSAPETSQSVTTLSSTQSGAGQNDASSKNGQHYLLTGLTLFISHEPCLMCSMALTHSRVKEVYYLIPMSKTGGCGGAACVPKLEGVNHRFSIGKWRAQSKTIEVERLDIEDDVDA